MNNWIAHVSSACAVFSLVLVFRAFWPLIRKDLDPFGRLMILGTMLLAIAHVGRSLWWDVARVLFGPHWETVRDALGGLAINVVPNTLVIIASVLYLRARHLLISEDSREEWFWWTSAWHPGQPFFIRLYRKMFPK